MYIWFSREPRRQQFLGPFLRALLLLHGLQDLGIRRMGRIQVPSASGAWVYMFWRSLSNVITVLGLDATSTFPPLSGEGC